MTGIEEAAGIAAAVGSAAAEAGTAAGAASAAGGLGGAAAAALPLGAAAAGTGPGVALGAAGAEAGLVAPPSVAGLTTGAAALPVEGFMTNTGPAGGFISQANPGTPSFFEPPPAAGPGGYGLKELTQNDALMQMLQGVMKAAKGPAAPPVPDMPGGGVQEAQPQTAAMQALARFKPFRKLSIGGGGGGGDPMTALLMRLLRGA